MGGKNRNSRKQIFNTLFAFALSFIPLLVVYAVRYHSDGAIIASIGDWRFCISNCAGDFSLSLTHGTGCEADRVAGLAGIVGLYRHSSPTGYGWEIETPSWLAFLFSGAIAVGGVTTLSIARSRLIDLASITSCWQTAILMKCPTCGYDLRATPDRCPECGWATQSTSLQ